MLKLSEKLQIPSWVSSRAYVLGGEYRSIIFNNLTHSIATLEGEASKIWGMILHRERTFNILELAQEFDSTSERDLAEFFEELVCDGYLVPLNRQEINKFSPSDSDISIEANDDSFRGIEDEFGRWLDQFGLLNTAFLEVTYRCNEKCLHCYNPGAAHSPDEKPNRKTAELSTQEYFSLIDELMELGVYSLSVSGGEFFLRKDAYEILDYLKRNRIRTTIYTNALKLKVDDIDKISGIYPYQIHISVYSVNPEVHDHFTQVPGSWSKTMQNARALAARGIQILLKCPVTKYSSNETTAFKALAEQMGVSVVFDGHITASNDGAIAPTTLNVRDYASLVNLAVEPSSPWYVGEKGSIQKRTIDLATSRPCGIGSSLSIAPDGEVYPCVAVPSSLGNIRTKGELTKIWMGSDKRQSETDLNSLKFWRDFSYSDSEECGTHSRCEFCSRCIGGSFNQHGDPRKPTSDQCLHASAREHAATLVERGYSKQKIQELFPLTGERSVELISIVEI